MTATARARQVSTRFGSSRLTRNLGRSSLALGLVAGAQAAVIGFNGNQALAGWEYNQGDAGTPLQIVNNETIAFTTGAGNRRSLWHRTPQDISQFEVDFTYRINPIPFGGSSPGVTFILQNAASGVDALAQTVYGYGFDGIAPSAGITLELATVAGHTRSGFYQNGVIASGSSVISPVNAFTLRELDVNIRYDGNVLAVTFREGDNVFGPQNYLIGSLASIVGGSTAYVGFGGGTDLVAEQYLSNFRFVPEPTAGLAFLLALPALRRWTR